MCIIMNRKSFGIVKVEKIFNEGESTQSLDEYKNEIMKKFNLKNDLARDAS